MNEIKIDKEIPIPVRNKWPFASMQVGDSFAVSRDIKSRLYSAVYFARKQLGHKFVTKQVGDIVRCWRVE